MLLIKNLFLCIHLESNFVRLFNNFFGSDLTIIISVKHKSHFQAREGDCLSNQEQLVKSFGRD